MKFRPNPNALYEVRRLPATQAWVRETCQRIADACGDGYSWSDQQGRRNPSGRWRGVVAAHSYQARLDNARNNTLVRELARGRR